MTEIRDVVAASLEPVLFRCESLCPSGTLLAERAVEDDSREGNVLVA